MLFYFFSSRRRNTSFDCDWSSDLCSSDLPLRLPLAAPHLGRGEAQRAEVVVGRELEPFDPAGDGEPPLPLVEVGDAGVQVGRSTRRVRVVMTGYAYTV